MTAGSVVKADGRAAAFDDFIVFAFLSINPVGSLY